MTLCRLASMFLFVLLSSLGAGQEPSSTTKSESFDRDPGWEGVNNRPGNKERRQIRQDFGFSPSANAGGQPGEIGGWITPCGEPAYYAATIATRTFDEPLEASGRFMGEGREFNVLIGFFNHKTLNEWRTPNTIALRFYGRGDVFYPYVEYCSSKWRAGADNPGGFSEVRNAETGRSRLVGFAARAPHNWSIRYDPNGNNGMGSITAKVDGETAICHLDSGHKADGATFNRFGLLNVVKSADGGGQVWLDDITVNGETESFGRDPKWSFHRNRVRYESGEVRQRFDFGFSPTQYAGGRRKGELGGLVYRGDDRSEGSMAAYGDRVGPLSMDRPIHASGRVTLRRAVSDSTAMIGFYNSIEGLKVNRTGREGGIPQPFLGVAIEGPSRDGFFFYPTYHAGGVRGYADGPNRPPIYPDGRSHRWSLDYDPGNAGGKPTMRVKLGDRAASLEVDPTALAARVLFDRFGIITTTTDGNAQVVYFDELRYTAR